MQSRDEDSPHSAPPVLWVLLAALLALTGWAVADLVGVQRLARLNAQDWAAWVQAIGSLVALFIAVYLPHREQISQRKNARQTAEVFAASVVATLEMLASEVQNDRGKYAIHVVRARLRSAQHSAQAVRLELLPVTGLLAIEGLRSVVDTCLGFLAALETSQWKTPDRSANDACLSYVAAARRFGASISGRPEPPSDGDF